MSFYEICIDGKAYRAMQTDEDNYILETPHWITTVLLQDPDRVLACWQEQVVNCSGQGRYFQHGLNTVSFISMEGTWIVASPWKNYVTELVTRAIDIAGVLAVASVQEQWRYLLGQNAEVSNRLAMAVCNDVPAWSGMTAQRKKVLQQQFRELIDDFLVTQSGLDSIDSHHIVLESHVGTAFIPDELVRLYSYNLTGQQIETDYPGEGTPNWAAIDYWRASVFTMWWKGFW